MNLELRPGDEDRFVSRHQIQAVLIRHRNPRSPEQARPVPPWSYKSPCRYRGQSIRRSLPTSLTHDHVVAKLNFRRGAGRERQPASMMCRPSVQSAVLHGAHGGRPISFWCRLAAVLDSTIGDQSSRLRREPLGNHPAIDSRQRRSPSRQMIAAAFRIADQRTIPHRAQADKTNSP